MIIPHCASTLVKKILCKVLFFPPKVKKKVAHCYSYHRFLRAPLLLSRETWTSLDFCTKGGRPAVKFGAQNSRRMWHFWHLMHGCSRCGCEQCEQKCLIALEAYLKPLKNFSTLVKEFAMFTRSVAQEALTKLGIHQSHALENRNAEWNFRRCYCGKIIRSQIFRLAWVNWVVSTNWYLWLSFTGLNLSFLWMVIFAEDVKAKDFFFLRQNGKRKPFNYWYTPAREQKIPLSLHICILRLPAFLQQSIIQGQCHSSCFVSTGAKIVNFRFRSLFYISLRYNLNVPKHRIKASSCTYNYITNVHFLPF